MYKTVCSGVYETEIGKWQWKGDSLDVLKKLQIVFGSVCQGKLHLHTKQHIWNLKHNI